MTKVTIEEIQSRLNNNEDITFVDSRSAEAWNKSEVKASGAIRIPPDAAEKHIADVSRNDFLAVYCT